MKNIKLFIDKKLVDLDYSNLNISLTKAVTDFNDLTSRKGNYSYSFKLPLTPNNQQIFKFINNLDVINKFKKPNDYSAQLYVNDNLLFEGSYVLQNIDKNFYNGNLNAQSLDVFNLIGEKSLRDLKLPEIDFEGVQFLYDTDNSNEFQYLTGSDSMLNKNLGFDMLSLINGYKDSNYGLVGSTIDYKEYYETVLINYYNQYIPNGLKQNQIESRFTIYDMMPNIRFIKVLEQIFKDINLNVKIENGLLNNNKILIPFTDSSNDPVWNWKHLASLHVCSDNTAYNKAVGSVQTQNYYENFFLKDIPLIMSKCFYLNNNLNDNRRSDFNVKFLGVQNDKTFSNHKFDYNYSGQFTRFGFQNQRKDNNDIITSMHHIPLNKLIKDPLNNFEIGKPAPINNLGWSYTCPVDGEYEFDLNVNHEIRFFNPNYQDRLKHYYPNLEGYNDITYSNERWLYQNTVMFVKYNEGDVTNFYDFEQNLNANSETSQGGVVWDNKNCKMLTNFQNENVIAFYNPMLRDLHKGERNDLVLEDYFIQKNSILKETNTFPQSEEDRINYFGFNLDTTILNFENDIVSNSSNANIDKTKKLVRCARNGKKGHIYKTYDLTLLPDKNWYGSYQRGNFDIEENFAKGDVKFKFKTKLNKGESIRMYYVTRNQLTDYAGRVNIAGSYNYVDYDIALYESLGVNPYIDLYTDDINVNSYKITPLFGGEKLKLANFLPNLKQKDFLTDFIKTNNLYYDIKDNQITFKKRDDFFRNKIQKDLTANIDITDIQIEPNKLYEKTTFGLNNSDTDDLRENIQAFNPVKTYNLDENIYTNKETLNNTSKLFVSSYKKQFEYYEDSNATTISIKPTQIINLINLTEDNKINNLNGNIDNEANFNTSNRLILASDDYLELTKSNKFIKINTISYKQTNEIEYKLRLNLPDLYYSNEIIFNQLINDRFINLEDSSIVTFNCYLTPLEYSSIKLNGPVSIMNTIYYIQSINKYDALNNNLCEIKLLKI